MYNSMDRSAVKALVKRGRDDSQVGRELGMNRKTVKTISEGLVEKKYERRTSHAEADRFKDRILAWHQSDVTIQRMYQLAQEESSPGEEPYRGSRSAFFARAKLFIDGYKQQRKERFVRFEGMPGEYCQVDWGEIRNFPFVRGGPETRYFLAVRLKFSRKCFVTFTRDMTLETLIRGLRSTGAGHIDA